MNTRSEADRDWNEQVEVDDALIFIRSIGTGPGAVVLHGGPGADSSTLSGYLDVLADGRLLRYYDQRGCGRSTCPPDSDLGWHRHVADLAAVLEHFRSDAATLVGHSWGALLALLYAAANRDRLGRLALIAPAPISGHGRELFMQRLAERLESPDVVARRRALENSGLKQRNPTEYRRRAFQLSMMPYVCDPDDARRVKPFLVAERVRDAVWRSLGEYDLTNDLQRLRVPTLLIHGRHDPIPLEESQHTADVLGARIEVFEQSGHLPFLEEPERFRCLMDEFLPRTCHG